MKNHTIAICDHPTLSENAKRLFASIVNVLEPNTYELIYLATGRSHAEQLNMALDACRTKYILFVDSDAEFVSSNVNIFNELDEFWDTHPNAGSVSAGNVLFPTKVDESPQTPYFNFFVTSFNMKNLSYNLKFDEAFIKTQCVDVAWFRALRFWGYENWAHPCLNLTHHHTGGHADYVKINQKVLVEMFGCPTDAAPERSPNGWRVYKEYLKRKNWR